ncbi:Uncharacterised protein [Acidipropionibacterium jensenii]|uniref:Uncharacterized protein n=1 Tax=Acidipropionibacterium jensenii TaxID=1749 RepID=A0A3S4YXF8_9ACTN|nr:hypothetical protein [Acidipropionibacterium jensenii]VEI03410.1 Uncharacterised protein [Acidipropionibacterium jensenii]
MTTSRLHREATGTALAVATGLALFSLPAVPAQAMSVHDGWCVKDTGLAVVVDFSHTKASLWPNSRGYVVKCIVNPRITSGARAAALNLTGIPHVTQSDGEVVSILGLTKNEQVWGWTHGTNKSGKLAWMATNDAQPSPQVNGFEYWLAASSQYGLNSFPAVQPQFASAGGNNNGDGGGDGSLNPGAPKQTYNPGSGAGGGGKGNGNKTTNGGAARGPGGNGGSGNGGSNGSGTGGRSGTSGGSGTGSNNGGGAGNQQSTTAAAKAQASAKAKSPSAKPSGSASPTPGASDNASAAASPVYAAESPKGSASQAGSSSDSKNWMWAGIGLAAVIVAAAVTAGIQGLTTGKKKDGPTPPSAKR